MQDKRNPKSLYHSDIWEDEVETTSKKDAVQPAEQVPEEDFETLLRGEESRVFDRMKQGDTVTGTILSIGSESIFLDVGQRSEGVIERAQFEEKELAAMKPGDKLTLFVAKMSSAGIELAKTLRSKDMSKDRLYEALNSGVPVEGKVVAENKGGYTVEVAGGKGFVPFSQMDVVRGLGPAEYLNKTFRFRVTQIKGRDIVLSRAALIREEQAEAQSRLLGEIEPDQVHNATVIKREKFGIFVDVGSGLTALIPMSEISYSRSSDILDKFQPGDQLQVKIISVDRSTPKPRIAASLKQLGGDPWDVQADKLAVGSTIKGEVTRLAAFGAFVEIYPGIDGLLHISEMSAKKRINQPGEVVHVGQKVEVKITAIDRIQKRISLSMKALDPDAQIDEDTRKKFLKDAEKAKDDEHRGVEFTDVKIKGSGAFAKAFEKANRTTK